MGRQPGRDLVDARGWSRHTATARRCSSPGFAFRLFRAGDQVFATSRGDLLRITVPGGPVARLGVTGLADTVEEALGDADHLYLTVFKRSEILRVPVTGGKPARIATLRRAVLGLHGGTLYAASYATGVLVALPAAGGPTPPARPTTLARGLVRPTAIAADDTHVFVYGEKDQALRRIDPATGSATILARALENSDELVSDGPWLYTFAKGARPALLRIAKDGSRPPQVLADDLGSPYRIAVDERAIYVTSRDRHTIVRLDKAALPAP